MHVLYAYLPTLIASICVFLLYVKADNSRVWRVLGAFPMLITVSTLLAVVLEGSGWLSRPDAGNWVVAASLLLLAISR